MLAGLVHAGINTGKGSQRFSVGESGHIADLSNELWAIGLPNAIDAITVLYSGSVDVSLFIFLRSRSTCEEE